MIKSRKESEVIYLLLDQYDKDQKAILRPEHVVKKKKGFPETVVFEFSQALIMETAKRYRGVEAGHLVSVAGNTPIYKIDYHGRELGISQCWIGASACISNMEEIVAMGARKIFVCGECGVLDGTIERCKADPADRSSQGRGDKLSRLSACGR